MHIPAIVIAQSGHRDRRVHRIRNENCDNSRAQVEPVAKSTFTLSPRTTPASGRQ